MTAWEPQAHGSQPWVEATPRRSRGPRRVRCKRHSRCVRYRSANKSVLSAKYHIVWCPKYRRAVLSDPVGDRLKAIVGEVCGQRGAEVLEVELMPDHVHLLVEVPTAVALSRFVQLVKGRWSRLLRQELPRLRRLPCLWRPSWFVSTVGGAPLHVVRRYVENQKQAA